MNSKSRLKPLMQALENHSAEGVAILTSEPWRYIHAAIYVMAGLVAAALLWSFLGRADVIVSAQGTLWPE